LQQLFDCLQNIGNHQRRMGASLSRVRTGSVASDMLAITLKERLLARSDTAVVTICGTESGRRDHDLTGGCLDAAARARAASLLAAFDPAAGPLAVVMPCGTEFLETLFACIYAGLTVAPMAPPRGPAQTSRFNAMVEDCRPVAILCASATRGAVETATAGQRARVPVMEASELPARPPLLASPAADASRPAVLQYTSGSTRAPRGVMLSGDALLANAALVSRTWGQGPDGRMGSWLPHFHDMGLMSILYPMLNGGVTFLMDPLHMIQRPVRWLRMISERRITDSGGPAFAFAHVLNEVTPEQSEGLDLSCWSDAFCGAEPVAAELMAAFRTRFAANGLAPHAVHASYGLAEYALMACGGQGRPDERRPDAPPGCERVEPCRIAGEMSDLIRIVDPDTGAPLPDGAPGEIWLSGPSKADGYLGDAGATDRLFHARLPGDESGASWLRTGDLGVRREADLYVTGRLKDVLFANGRKIPAPDVESLAARQDPALNEMAAAAFMADDLVSGRAVLLIEMKRRARLTDEAATRDRIRRAVMGAWSLDLVEVRFLAPGSLPRTSSGKVQRRLAARSHPVQSMAPAA
jgi:acyl-CoA synthetase (AMP-forming)/AMP-acid ligase II